MNEIRDKLRVEGLAQWKREERRRLWSRIIRWGTGIPLLFCCFLIPWFGPFLALLGCILIAPDIAGWASRIVTRLILPYHDGKRQPLYSIPESLVAKGRYEEAEKEYEAIMQAFPKEAKPHIRRNARDPLAYLDDVFWRATGLSCAPRRSRRAKPGAKSKGLRRRIHKGSRHVPIASPISLGGDLGCDGCLDETSACPV